jgi:hypothetical protein
VRLACKAIIAVLPRLSGKNGELNSRFPFSGHCRHTALLPRQIEVQLGNSRLRDGASQTGVPFIASS